MMNQNAEIKNIGELIFLHLIPGIAFCIVYIFISKSGLLVGCPKIVIASLSSVFSTIPIELGLLFYAVKKDAGNYNIFNILGLKSRLSIVKMIGFSLLLLVAGAIIMTVMKPFTDYSLNVVFHWIPDWYTWSQDMSLYSRNMILLTIAADVIIFTLLVPVIEEFYFRGYLLSRMKWMGKYSVLFNVVLFSIYNFQTPWLLLTRILYMLPFVYLVYKKDSMKLGIFVHCIANFTEVVPLLLLLK
jgi:uncharacterized protein